MKKKKAFPVYNKGLWWNIDSRSDYFLKTKVQVPWKKKKAFPVYNKGVWWNIDSQIITTAREPGPWHAMIYEH